jgi:uncharacterized membrane protein required for colicin V production
MMGLQSVFLTLVVIFAFIGLSRGWAKELLVGVAVILAMFTITVLERFLPPIRDMVTQPQSQLTLFWIRTIILGLLVFFGYQTPSVPKLAATNRFAREKLQDSLLGLFLGAFNGYLVFGTFWYFLIAADYPIMAISKPDELTAAGQAALRIIEFLPPQWLGTPTIYFAVIVALAFILVVFI